MAPQERAIGAALIVGLALAVAWLASPGLHPSPEHLACDREGRIWAGAEGCRPRSSPLSGAPL